MKIVIKHNKEKIGINDLVFKGDIILHSNNVTMDSHTTTLEVDTDEDIRMFIFGKLEDLTLYGNEEGFEIASMTIIEDGERYEVCENVLQKYQYMRFSGMYITKEKYWIIANEVHSNDRMTHFTDLIHNVIDNMDIEKEEISKLEEFLADPKREYIDFVEDKIDEHLTGEDEYYIVKQLVKNFGIS